MTTMTCIANICVVIVGLLHVGFLIYEMFFWDKSFSLPKLNLGQPKYPTTPKSLAANLGLYNGFVAAGLCWSLILGAPGTPIKLFFLSFVVIAGVFGGLTTRRVILLFQALPGAVALVLVWLSV